MRRPATKSNPAPTRASTPVMARSRFPVWLMAVLLALVTIALYWPATRCDFVNFDDPDLCHRESSRSGRFDLGGGEMGVLQHGTSRLLGAADVVVAHAGLPALRFESLGTSSDQCAAARRQHRAGLSVAATDDRGDVAEPVGGGVVWVASAACGIGGLGGGTQGCAEHASSVCWRSVVMPATRKMSEASRKSERISQVQHSGTGAFYWLAVFSRWA